MLFKMEKNSLPLFFFIFPFLSFLSSAFFFLFCTSPTAVSCSLALPCAATFARRPALPWVAPRHPHGPAVTSIWLERPNGRAGRPAIGRAAWAAPPQGTTVGKSAARRAHPCDRDEGDWGGQMTGGAGAGAGRRRSFSMEEACRPLSPRGEQADEKESEAILRNGKAERTQDHRSARLQGQIWGVCPKLHPKPINRIPG
uniref:Uncharacterized protein n=1 Tax=Setaria viridis TaxID=4556 RepID=A0A4U6TZ51_SETVI|nr:hypothetical protein SEVIR_6G021200v2 [Setaria viridis]